MFAPKIVVPNQSQNIMRKFILLITSLFTIAASGNVNVSAGHVDEYPAFESQYITPRTVRVWLPEGFTPEQKYDVIYMHDGQMLFDPTTTWNGQEWEVDEVITTLNRANSIRPTIVVGVDNIQETRYGDYFPAKALNYLPQGTAIPEQVKYDADNYLKFLVTELKHFIDKTYPTNPQKENTGVLGSSMGGLISLYALCEYPDVFGGAVCMSTHTPMVLEMNSPESVEVWAKAFRDYLKENLPPANSAKIYMDRGDRTIDAYYPVYQTELDEMMRSLGWEAPQFISNIFPGDAHTEVDWAARLRYPIKFLVGKGE